MAILSLERNWARVGLRSRDPVVLAFPLFCVTLLPCAISHGFRHHTVLVRLSERVGQVACYQVLEFFVELGRRLIWTGGVLFAMLRMAFRTSSSSRGFSSLTLVTLDNWRLLSASRNVVLLPVGLWAKSHL